MYAQSMDNEDRIKPESIQVNIELTGEVAEAFTRYWEESGIQNKAPAGRALIVKQLRIDGFLPEIKPQARRSQKRAVSIPRAKKAMPANA